MLVTGSPGVGKTTLIQRVFRHYSNEGLCVAGIITEEARSGTERIGFRISSLASGAQGWLAKTGRRGGLRVGKYTVISEDLERVGVEAMEQAIRKNPDVVLIDEVGPMEMTNRGFRAALSELLSSKMIVIATVKQGSYYPEVETIMANPGTVKMEISKETREQDFERITSIVDTWIGERNKPI